MSSNYPDMKYTGTTTATNPQELSCTSTNFSKNISVNGSGVIRKCYHLKSYLATKFGFSKRSNNYFSNYKEEDGMLFKNIEP
ncbi:hypothetical protein NQ315_011673 [Exocentrus adspersus]|uniref:Uncharacterized protein n=1 Tax=Exocentrus adspersus TaxID=1586481 RepID=A0AAV8W080_9CUCU|nr:hypothetical protein NQ315_011673 [Exocentrus adspersus]